MSLPTQYNELSLREYMFSVTKRAAEQLKLNSSTFREAVTDTMLRYGVTDLASATDIGKLRALAKVEAWRVIVEASAADFDFGQSNGTAVAGSYEKRSQLHDQAEKEFERATSEAERSGYLADTGGFVIEMGKLTFSDAYAGVSNG